MKFHRPVHSFSIDNSRRGFLYHCIWINCGGEWSLFHVQATIFSNCERLYSKKFCKYFKTVLCYISSSIFNSCETCLEAGSWHFYTLIYMVSYTANGRRILKARDLMFRMTLPHYWLVTQFSYFCTEYYNVLILWSTDVPVLTQFQMKFFKNLIKNIKIITFFAKFFFTWMKFPCKNTHAVTEWKIK